MPSNYRLEIFKSLQSEQWANSYTIRHDNLVEAETAAQLLLDFERNLHDSRVFFDYYIVSHPDPLTRIFKHVPINLPGQRNTDGAQYLPLFNTVRVDLETTDTDPGRKYFRIPLPELNQQNGQLEAVYRTSVQTVLDTNLNGNLAVIGLVTRDAVYVVQATVHAQVQMRQLHRRRKRTAL